ncbi:hypothetical protein [Nitrosomonas sp.]|uniref:hypothetical protein n=1 Tax=Nitrosomonas sp. TaxID=42353 RepID=UPI0025FE4382|nr:hypothetical protein [Nitrosomonas sp.]
MSSRPSKVEQSGRPLLKKVIGAILGGLLLAAAIPFFVILYGEAKREQLIARYQAPPALLEDIFAKKEGAAGALMNSHETVVCAIGGYGSVNELSLLNAKQKSSLPKEELPSEDMAWYLLFFASDAVSRIYLIDSAKLEGNVEGTGAGCIDRDGQFVVLKTKEISGDTKFVLNLSKRGQ